MCYNNTRYTIIIIVIVLQQQCICALINTKNCLAHLFDRNNTNAAHNSCGHPQGVTRQCVQQCGNVSRYNQTMTVINKRNTTKHAKTERSHSMPHSDNTIHYMCVYYHDHDTPQVVVVRMYRKITEKERAMSAQQWHEHLSTETADLWKHTLAYDQKLTVFHALSLPDITTIDDDIHGVLCDHITEVAANLTNPSLWNNNVTTTVNLVYRDSSTAVLKNIETVINNGVDESLPEKPTVFCNVFTNITARTHETTHYTGE